MIVRPWVAFAVVVSMWTNTVQRSGEIRLEGVWETVATTGSRGEFWGVGEIPRSLYIFTRTYYSVVEASSRRPALPAGQAGASPAELLAVFGPFDAHAGRYELSNGELRLRPTVARDEKMANGAVTMVYTVRRDGAFVVLAHRSTKTVHRLRRLE